MAHLTGSLGVAEHHAVTEKNKYRVVLETSIGTRAGVVCDLRVIVESPNEEILRDFPLNGLYEFELTKDTRQKTLAGKAKEED